MPLIQPELQQSSRLEWSSGARTNLEAFEVPDHVQPSEDLCDRDTVRRSSQRRGVSSHMIDRRSRRDSGTSVFRGYKTFFVPTLEEKFKARKSP